MCKKETEPLAETLLSNIQATWHFIKPFESFPPYLKKVILVKTDVTSLCTTMPHEQEIEISNHI